MLYFTRQIVLHGLQLNSYSLYCYYKKLAKLCFVLQEIISLSHILLKSINFVFDIYFCSSY